MSTTKMPPTDATPPRLPGWVRVRRSPLGGEYWAYWNGVRWSRVEWYGHGSEEIVDLDGDRATTVEDGIALIHGRRRSVGAPAGTSEAVAWTAGIVIAVVLMIVLCLLVLAALANALIGGMNEGL